MSFRWVSLNEAVGILGIPISTLRRQIDDRQLESKLKMEDAWFRCQEKFI